MHKRRRSVKTVQRLSSCCFLTFSSVSILFEGVFFLLRVLFIFRFGLFIRFFFCIGHLSAGFAEKYRTDNQGNHQRDDHGDNPEQRASNLACHANCPKGNANQEDNEGNSRELRPAALFLKRTIGPVAPKKHEHRCTEDQCLEGGDENSKRKLGVEAEPGGKQGEKLPAVGAYSAHEDCKYLFRALANPPNYRFEFLFHDVHSFLHFMI